MDTKKEEELAGKLQVKFGDLTVLHQALVHRSFLNENSHEKESNERLEFLGDAVLEFLVSKRLYRTYPQLPEGVLTNLRAHLVNTKALAKIARRLGLGERLYLSRGEDKGGGGDNDSLLADTFEAVIGAIYVDQGRIEPCEQFLEREMFGELAKIDIENLKDAKSKLQEVVQAKDWPTPVYELARSEGPDHAKKFWVVVKSGERLLGEGEGESKQAAEQQAAQKALGRVEKKVGK